MLSDWGAFTCGELLNPFMDNTGTKNVMNLSSAVQDTKNGKTATVGGKNGVTTKCQCDGLMHKCEKYQVAMALVRFVLAVNCNLRDTFRLTGIAQRT